MLRLEGFRHDTAERAGHELAGAPESTRGRSARSYRRKGSGAIVPQRGGVTEQPLLKHRLRVFH